MNLPELFRLGVIKKKSREEAADGENGRRIKRVWGSQIKAGKGVFM